MRNRGREEARKAREPKPPTPSPVNGRGGSDNQRFELAAQDDGLKIVELAHELVQRDGLHPA